MKMIGLARLGRDAEIRRTPDGTAVANLSLSYVCGMKRDGDQYPPSQWIDATLWGKQAEALAQFLTKGSVHCFTLSDVRMEEYDGNDGYLKTKLAARVDSVELGPRQGDGSGQTQQATGTTTGARRPASSGSAPKQAAPAAGAPGKKFDDFDDDIPF